MDGLGPKGSNAASKNCDEYGGVPFVAHMGRHCHRGVRAFKQAALHPTETTKRVFYHEDGSGRDGYISSNNGGLTVTQ